MRKFDLWMRLLYSDIRICVLKIEIWFYGVEILILDALHEAFIKSFGP